MGSVTGFTKDRMLEVENSTVVSGLVDVNGKLLLTTRGGVAIDAGVVRGQNGPAAIGLGAIVAWGGDYSAPIPANTLELNGQLVSAATYSGLAAIYPAWRVNTQLKLPDLRGKTIAGYMPGDSVFGTFGTTVGEKLHTLSVSEMPAHTHAAPTGNGITGNGYEVPVGKLETQQTNYDYVGSAPTASTGGGLGHNNVQPTYVARWLVICSDDIGEYSPTVQSALVSRATAVETKVDTFESRVVKLETPATIVSAHGEMALIPGNNYVAFAGLVLTGGVTSPNTTTITIPTDGLYQINVSQLVSPNGASYYELRINNATTYHAYTNGSMTDLHVNVIRKLLAGATIRIYYNGAAPTASWGGLHSNVSILRLQ